MYDARVHASYARLASLAIAAALHALAIGALLQMKPVRSAMTQAAPIMVQLLSPPRIEAPSPPELPAKPRIERPVPKAKSPQRPRGAPKPRAAQPRPAPTPPIMTAAPEAQSFVPPAPPLPPRKRAPEPAPATATLSAPPAPTVPARVSVTPPGFNAIYLNNPAPSYPALSRRMGEEGKVVLRVYVTEGGLPEQVQIKASSGFSRLDSVALEAVKHWKFVPARRGDDPVAAWVIVPISFSLRS